jgi:hypothetical protein
MVNTMALEESSKETVNPAGDEGHQTVEPLDLTGKPDSALGKDIRNRTNDNGATWLRQQSSLFSRKAQNVSSRQETHVMVMGSSRLSRPLWDGTIR